MLNPTLAKVVVAVGRLNQSGIQLLGTAFAVSAKHFATAAHVVEQSDANLMVVPPKIESMSDYQDTTDIQIQGMAVKICSLDPIRDIALLELEEPSIQFGYTLSGADSAPAGSPVVTIGYPHALHGRLVVTEQSSTVGARVLLGTPAIKSKHLILNIQTRPRQSGSPVLTSDGSRVCAMVLGSYAPTHGGGIIMGDVDPATLHQTTHAISAEYIKGML